MAVVEVQQGSGRRGAWLLLGCVVVLGLGLRLYGMNWDDNHLLHPDERKILLVSDAMRARALSDHVDWLEATSPLNPGFFAYGSLTFYLLRLVTDAVSVLAAGLPPLAEWLDLTELNQLRVAGRGLSVLADTSTIVLTFVLGRRLKGAGVGLLASMFVSAATIHVQAAHFYTADTLLVPACLVAVILLIEAAERTSRRWLVAAGIAIGLALAVKLSALPLLLGAGYALRLRARASAASGVDRDALALGAACAGAFVCVQPFVVLDWPTFLRDALTQAAIISGRRDTVYTRQYLGRLPLLYNYGNLVVFGLGLPLGIAAVAGAARELVAWRRRSGAMQLALVWLVAHSVVTGLAYAQFLRYLLPVVPVLCVCAASLLVAGPRPEWSAPLAGAIRRCLPALAAVVVAATVAYAVAFSGIYSRPHPAITASRWIYEHVPAGATVAIEHWDEALPLPIDTADTYLSAQTQGYRVLTLRLYDQDGDGKLEHILETLEKADAVLIYSNRLYGVIPRLRERYPITTAYYRLLFAERLGYELAYASCSYPTLAGLTLADDTLTDAGLPVPALLRATRPGTWLSLGRADESFSVYDHPLVLVFAKARTLGWGELLGMLTVEMERADGR